MRKLLTALVSGICLCFLFCAPALAEGISEGYEIGFSYYDPDEWEGVAVREYLEDYVSGNFDISFHYNADRIDSAEDEIAFVEELHDLGIPGLISTMSTYVEDVLPVCEQYGMYYMLTYVTISDDVYERIKDNPCFLGVIGPDSEDESTAGESIADYLAALDTEGDFNYLVVTGGSSMGNEMHRLRTVGILSELQKLYNLSYEDDVGTLAESSEVTEVETGTDMKLILLPGYLTEGEQITALLEDGSYNAVASCMTISYGIDDIVKLESENGYDIKVGMVDCYTDQSYQFMNDKDSNGDPKLNCLVGKYSASVAPSVVAMCNAYAGYSEDFRDDDSAFCLHQDLWYAPDTETYNELYALTVGITENTYSAVDMMQAMKEYNQDADFETFRAFTEQ